MTGHPITARKGSQSISRQRESRLGIPASLAAIDRLTRNSARAETIDDIYAAAVDAVGDTLGVSRASISLFDPHGVLRFKAWRGLSDAYRRSMEGHSSWSADSSDTEPILIASLETDPRLELLRPSILKEGIRALAFFPLLQPGHLLGKFMAYYEAPHEFNLMEVMLGRIIAGHVAYAVQRKQAEVAARNQERELSDFFEHASIGLHWVGPDGTILRVNQAELDLLGYTREEYVGRHISAFHVDREVIDDILRRLGAGEVLREYEARMRHKDGSIRYVVINSSGLWEDGQFIHSRCFTRDVTERRHTDVALQRLAAIVDSSDDVIVSKDLEGTIQTWNRAAERLFQYSAEEAIGRSITMLIPREHVQEEEVILGKIRRGERVDHFETVRLAKDGRRIDVALTVSPVRDQTGHIIGASKIARDITEIKRAAKEREEILAREQQARTEAEAANRAKDEFLVTLSHELRTPLNAILGWTQLLANTPYDPGRVAKAVETIGRNAKQQVSLIEDLLDVSSILAGRLRLNTRPVDLVNVLVAALDSIRPTAAEKGVALETHLDPDVGPVMGDPDRLQQIFWNLLSNAVKFTSPGGRVSVQLELARSRALIRFTDTGAGISQDMLPVIFERFRQADSSSTRSHGGLGLGLAIVRELVERHGGTVEGSSPGEGQGATFTVVLPMRPLRLPSSIAATQSEVVRCDGIHTLLVDDERDGRELLKLFLEQCGGVVTAVESAAAALAAIEHDRPDVVVSDIAMPETDGYELMRCIRASAAGEHVPAIALTAHATVDARAQAFRAGYDTYLAKPVDPAELAAAVNRLARRSGRV